MNEEQTAEREPPAAPAPVAETPAAKAAATLVASEGGKKVVMWMAIGALIAALIAYGFGRLQTHAKIEQAETAAQKAQGATRAAEQRLEQAKAETLAKDAVVRRLEARRLLDQAATALEERNFGIAEAALSTAAELLERSAQGAPPELVALQQELAKFRPVVTEDVGAQRARVIAWIKRFDRIAPTTAP